MRKMLMIICDMYALQYDIIFKAQKSKFLVIRATCWRSLYASMCKCVFLIGGNQIENVHDSFSHLGHIIDSRFTDDKDILFRRNSLATQTNNVLSFFRKLGFVTRIKLFKDFCSNMYGCELWSLNDSRPLRCLAESFEACD